MTSKFLGKYRVSMHRHYYRICKEQNRLYQELDAALTEAALTPLAEDEISANAAKQEECYEKREQAAVIGITFAALCLEAFFYDYAATELSDVFAEDVDKLDLPSKLLIVPWLVCGKALDRSSDVYEKLKQLSKDRNYLVHFKSKGFDLDALTNASDFHDELNKRFRKALENGIDAIPRVMKALGGLHGTPDLYVGMVCG